MTGKSQRAINLTGFFGYMPLFWLGALRDAADIRTHSPYFVQHVPLRGLHLVRLRGSCTEAAGLPPNMPSELPWTDQVAAVAQGPVSRVFGRSRVGKTVVAQSWFSEEIVEKLTNCYGRDDDAAAEGQAVADLRRRARILPTSEDQEELGFHGRRARDEIFLARRGILVEGVTERLLIHELGRALGWHLDMHGVSAIDLQQSGSAGMRAKVSDFFRTLQ